MQYEDQMRGFSTRQAQDIANQTLTSYKKETGLSDAQALRDESQWLKTWGVWLGLGADVLGGVGSAIGVMR